jgi:hypothetical protein
LSGITEGLTFHVNMEVSKYKIMTLKYYLCLSRKSSLLFNRPCIPSPTKPRTRSADDKVGSVDTISGLSIASSITVSLAGEYQIRYSNTMGGINIMPNPIPSITTHTIEIIAVTVTLFTYYYE